MKDFEQQPQKIPSPEEQYNSLTDMGYSAIAHILTYDLQSVEQAVALHERGKKLIEKGAIIGPCVLEGKIFNGGIALYTLNRHLPE